MAGHSKWANIKHRKAAQDAKRGKIFTRLIREITVAARQGGDDITSNPRLRAAVAAGRAANMTNDAVDRAIKRGAGGGDEAALVEVRYEGYGPGGIAVMVDCMTDNKNRTVAEVRHAFTKNGGNLGTDGSVAYLFEKQGVIQYAPGVDEDALMEAAIEAGATDVVDLGEGALEVTTAPEDYADVNDALVAAGFESVSSEITMVPATQADLADVDAAAKAMKMLDMMEDLDDVQKVYSNADFSDEILAQITA